MNSRNNKIYFAIIAIIFAVIFFLLYHFLPHYRLIATECDKTDIANAMMIELNSINNILTWGSFIIAALTTIGAVFGIGGSIVFTKHVNEQLDNAKTERDRADTNAKKILDNEKAERERFEANTNILLDTERRKRETFEASFDERIINIELKIDECCEKAQQKMQILEKTQVMQGLYFKKSIEFLYMISSNLLEKDDNDSLRNSLYHDLQIMMLYRYEIYKDKHESATILHQKKAALDYLKDHPQKDDISDLEYVAQNDPNAEIRRRAIEVIGVIKNNYNL